MRFKALTILCLFMWIVFPFNGHAAFIAKREDLKKIYKKSNIIVIASTGRSASTMLTEQIKKYAPNYRVLKTHLLPPDKKFKGKMIFIFSNPNQAAESAFYMTLHMKGFGEKHFRYVETADRDWLRKIGHPRKQTGKDNVLSYDAFGTYEHLKAWLYTQTKPTTPKNAQILAIKYENLWDAKTLRAIRSFLKIPHLTLPPKMPRGHKENELFASEIKMRKMYNLGTKKEPLYAAYHEATMLWEQAPPFQYLKITYTDPLQ